eukprot:7077106-Prymnesium_polylepis.1
MCTIWLSRLGVGKLGDTLQTGGEGRRLPVCESVERAALVKSRWVPRWRAALSGRAAVSQKDERRALPCSAVSEDEVGSG